MPCRQCDNGKWRWGSGPCTYDSRADCERANSERAEDDRVESLLVAAEFALRALNAHYKPGQHPTQYSRGALTGNPEYAVDVLQEAIRACRRERAVGGKPNASRTT